MKIKITKKVSVSPDGINVVHLEIGDEPDLDHKLCDIIINDLKSGEHITEKVQSPIDKSISVPSVIGKTNIGKPNNSDGDNSVIEKNREDLTVYQYAKVISRSYRVVIKAAKTLKISATHGNSSLTPDEQDRIKNIL